MVRAVNHPNLRVHLDTGCVTLAGDSIKEAAHDTNPVHFHASQPDLGDFSVPLSAHWDAAEALKATDYQGWVSIEMREQPDWKGAIRRAVAVLQPLLR